MSTAPTECTGTPVSASHPADMLTLPPHPCDPCLPAVLCPWPKMALHIRVGPKARLPFRPHHDLTALFPELCSPWKTPSAPTTPTTPHGTSSSELSSAYSSSPGTLAASVLGEGVLACGEKGRVVMSGCWCPVASGRSQAQGHLPPPWRWGIGKNSLPLMLRPQVLPPPISEQRQPGPGSQDKMGIQKL